MLSTDHTTLTGNLHIDVNNFGAFCMHFVYMCELNLVLVFMFSMHMFLFQFTVDFLQPYITLKYVTYSVPNIHFLDEI